MKAKNNYEVKKLAEVNMLIPKEGEMSLNGVLTLNETGFLIWKTLREECTIDELVDKIASEYSASREEIKEDVLSFVKTLREKGLIVE